MNHPNIHFGSLNKIANQETPPLITINHRHRPDKPTLVWLNLSVVDRVLASHIAGAAALADFSNEAFRKEALEGQHDHGDSDVGKFLDDLHVQRSADLIASVDCHSR